MIGVQSNIMTVPCIIGSSTDAITATINSTSYSVGPGNWNINLDGVKVTELANAFRSATSLTMASLRGIDTSGVTNFFAMFSFCGNVSAIDMADCDMSNAWNVNSVFIECYKLKTIDTSRWALPNARDAGSIFYNCRLLESVNLSNAGLANVTDIHSMFYLCSALTDVDFTGCDFGKVATADNMFYSCTSLTKIAGGLPNLAVSVSLEDSPITHDNAVVILNSLGTADSQTITFSASTYSTLTDDEKAIGTSKGWSIASA